MAVGKEIKTKINSVANTQKITSAMQMVAASKMRRTQDKMAQGKPYSERILLAATICMALVIFCVLATLLILVLISLPTAIKASF